MATRALWRTLSASRRARCALTLKASRRWSSGSRKKAPHERNSAAKQFSRRTVDDMIANQTRIIFMRKNGNGGSHNGDGTALLAITVPRLEDVSADYGRMLALKTSLTAQRVALQAEFDELQGQARSQQFVPADAPDDLDGPKRAAELLG